MTQLDGDIGSVFTVMQSWYDSCVLFPKSKAGFGWGQQIHRFSQRMEAGLDRKMLKSQPDFSSTFTPKPGWAQWSTGPSKTPATAAGLAMTLWLRRSRYSEQQTLGGEHVYFGATFFFFFLILFNFTILYWFCHISKWICHRYTCVPHPEPSSLLPPHTIPLGRPSALSNWVTLRSYSTSLSFSFHLSDLEGDIKWTMQDSVWWCVNMSARHRGHAYQS